MLTLAQKMMKRVKRGSHSESLMNLMKGTPSQMPLIASDMPQNKKNTPLKSINTKTKESLTHFNKNITPNKSFEKFKFGHYDVYNDEGYPADTRIYKYAPDNTEKSKILTRRDYSILSKRIERPYKQDSPAIAI